MQAGVFNKVFANGRANGRNIANVLHHGGQRNRYNRNKKAWELDEDGILKLMIAKGATYPELEKIGISVSRSTIPNDPNPPLKASGLRLGTPAVTTRGFKEVEIKKLAALIDKALKSGGDENILADLKKETAALAEGFPIPGF